MRIALVSGSYPPQPCGVGEYARRLSTDLLISGIEVEVITTESAERNVSPEVKRELGTWGVVEWWGTVLWMRHRKYDLVHIQYPAKHYGRSASVALLSVLLKVGMPTTPLVLTIHEYTITHILRRLSVLAIAMMADRIIFTTETEHHAVGRRLFWKRKRMSVIDLASIIPVTLTTEGERNDLRKKYALTQEVKVVAYFGFLHPNKGVELLLESFQRIASQSDARLLMLSLFEPKRNVYHSDLETRIRTMGIEEKVIWAGFQEPGMVSRHLAIADCALFPFSDGVSLRRTSFMTAMSHGVPTVTTSEKKVHRRIGLVDGVHCGIVAPDCSAYEVAGKVEEILSSPAKAHSMRHKALEWSRQFDWDGIVMKTLALYYSTDRSHV